MSVRDTGIGDLISALKQDWCESFDLIPVDDDVWTVATPFVMPDGDGFALLLERHNGRWRLSDAGVTASRAFAEVDVSAGAEARFTLAADTLGLDLEEWTLSTSLPDFPDALDIAHFLRAAVACYMAPELQPAITREDYYTQRLRQAVVERIEPGIPKKDNWYPPEDGGKLYRTDLRIMVPDQTPVLLFSCGTEQRAADAALAALHYQDWHVEGHRFAAVKPSVTGKAFFRLQDSLGDDRVERIDPRDRFKIRRVLRDLGVPTVAA